MKDWRSVGLEMKFPINEKIPRHFLRQSDILAVLAQNHRTLPPPLCMASSLRLEELVEERIEELRKANEDLIICFLSFLCLKNRQYCS